MKPFLIKLTTAALHLCNAIVSSLWGLVLTGTIVVVAFGFMSDPLETDLMLRRFQVLAGLASVMAIYVLSAVCLRRVLLDRFGRGLSAFFSSSVVVFFVGHLGLVIGLGLYTVSLLFEGEVQMWRENMFAQILSATIMGAAGCMLSMLVFFVLYLMTRKIAGDKQLAAPYLAPPSCFEAMFSKHTLLASAILSAVIISFVLLISL